MKKLWRKAELWWFRLNPYPGVEVRAIHPDTLPVEWVGKVAVVNRKRREVYVHFHINDGWYSLWLRTSQVELV